MFEQREGEVRLNNDPADGAADAKLVFIGEIRSPWKERADCPKSLRQARERQQSATVEIQSPYRPGLSGLKHGDPIILLSWLGHAPRNLIVQKPRRADGPRGTFALRSPVRPNPIGLHVVRLVTLEQDEGTLTIDAIDVLDRTALLDIKPWYGSTDMIAP